MSDHATGSLSETKVCGNVSHRPASCFRIPYANASSGQVARGLCPCPQDEIGMPADKPREVPEKPSRAANQPRHLHAPECTLYRPTACQRHDSTQAPFHNNRPQASATRISYRPKLSLKNSIAPKKLATTIHLDLRLFFNAGVRCSSHVNATTSPFPPRSAP